MPLVWRGALDLDQIWSKPGFFLILLLLQWMEVGDGRKATFSFNKVSFDGHLLFLRFLVPITSPAGLGGEGRRFPGERSVGSSRWWGVFWSCVLVLASGTWSSPSSPPSGCPWWMPTVWVGFGSSSFLSNKLVEFGGDWDLAGDALGGRHGDGLKGLLVGSGSPGIVRAASWRSHMVAKLGCHDFRPRWRPLHLPVQLLRMCVFNLLLRRLFFLDTAVQTFLRPSGSVPGAEMGRRAPRCSSASGDDDEGLDCFSANLCRVLCVRILDHVVLFFFLEVLYVIVTADE
jgi:hypothetical protein